MVTLNRLLLGMDPIPVDGKNRSGQLNERGL
jgi:hypothetical protein